MVPLSGDVPDVSTIEPFRFRNDCWIKTDSVLYQSAHSPAIRDERGIQRLERSKEKGALVLSLVFGTLVAP